MSLEATWGWRPQPQLALPLAIAGTTRRYGLVSGTLAPPEPEGEMPEIKGPFWVLGGLGVRCDAQGPEMPSSSFDPGSPYFSMSLQCAHSRF